MSVPVTLHLEPVAVSRENAAAALGVSLATFEQSIQPNLGLIHSGRRRLVPVAELRRWAEEHTDTPIVDQLRGVAR
jgi:hypothetical protein